MTNAQAPRKRGCFFYGCITGIVLLLIVAVGSYMVYRWFIGKVNEYTDTEPMDLPAIMLTDTELQELNQRIEDFGEALRQGNATEPLVLSGEEINALIAGEEQFKDRVYLTIEGDEIKGQISLPLDDLGFKGRYLNGAASVKASLRDDNLVVNVTSVEVKGKALPDEFMQTLRNQNMAEGAMDDPETREAISKIEELSVEDGKLTITPTKIPEPAP